MHLSDLQVDSVQSVFLKTIVPQFGVLQYDACGIELLAIEEVPGVDDNWASRHFDSMCLRADIVRSTSFNDGDEGISDATVRAANSARCAGMLTSGRQEPQQHETLTNNKQAHKVVASGAQYRRQ
ncbi:uncharacterized protein CCOS01_10186 [Colletotrichum costaricense]|uniref:Uncharacterized protein n=1 Tax=Colletotrichum costaricense TaxID=1209916 RepID=A0AAJ0DZA0_9PEZI|nr:uncharacterized protein CCOS01_10186 [Colletotrichum costaricense]KAK1522474.1 hypothetical protein CCOS01_10186 [Colletotrichum costaricense]